MPSVALYNAMRIQLFSLDCLHGREQGPAHPPPGAPDCGGSSAAGRRRGRAAAVLARRFPQQLHGMVAAPPGIAAAGAQEAAALPKRAARQFQVAVVLYLDAQQRAEVFCACAEPPHCGLPEAVQAHRAVPLVAGPRRVAGQRTTALRQQRLEDGAVGRGTECGGRSRQLLCGECKRCREPRVETRQGRAVSLAAERHPQQAGDLPSLP
mmetsp:Transcript_81482/g.213923  ORF Transcript_81482/g.213923 Transcript_81482/m.213923 type:complete len:209 (+) Transcript_81482:50-676(+)